MKPLGRPGASARRLAESIGDRIKSQVDVAERQEDVNPVGRIRQRFEHLRTERQVFIDEAQEMAELVVPGMYDDTMAETKGADSNPPFVGPNQSLIGQGVLALSWTMATVMLPPDGDYFARNIEQSVAEQLEQMEQLRKQQSEAMGQTGDPDDFVPISLQVNQELLRDDIIVRRQISASNHQEVLARALFHSLISGFAVFGNLTLSDAKAYTIQNSCAVFDSSHEAVEVIVVDRVPLVRLPVDVRAKLLARKIEGEALSKLDPAQQMVDVYTQQVVVSETELQINTEIEGVPIPSMTFKVPIDAPVFIPLPFMFLNEADPYPVGWLTYNRGDCLSYEHGELSIEGMVAAAATAILGLPPGARLTTEELQTSPGLSVVPVSDAKARLEAVVAPIAANLNEVSARQTSKERRLMMIFGMEFAIQRPGDRVTAEEIQRMSMGLQKLFGATYKQLERAWQYRHIKRQFFLAQEAKLIRPVDKSMYTLALTAGLQSQVAQENIAKMDQLLARDVQLAQLEQANSSFGRTPTMQWYAQQLKVDASAMLLTDDQKAEKAGIGQLLQVARSMGPQGPAMMAQLIQQMMAGGMPGVAPLTDGTSVPGGV